MLSLLSRTKSFRDPWVGHPVLNRRWQLHRRRLLLAESLCRWRRSLRSGSGSGLTEDVVHRLRRDGFVVLENVLPTDAFSALRHEAEAAVAAAADRHPLPQNQRQGFQPKQPFPGGFDRFDGGTLNRFLRLNPEGFPQAETFCHDRRLSALCREVIGLPMNPRKLELYLTRHGEETRTPDLQKELHRDTFFRAIKFWFFLHPVTPNDGPFEYVPGSHRLTSARLDWEQAKANAAIEHRRPPDASGSFRIQEEDLPALDLPAPVSVSCAANTLVLADVFGFHRRGAAQPGRERLAIYGWNRPYPFLPLTW